MLKWARAIITTKHETSTKLLSFLHVISNHSVSKIKDQFPEDTELLPQAV